MSETGASAWQDMALELRRMLASLWPLDGQDDAAGTVDPDRWTTLASSGWLDFVSGLRSEDTPAEVWAGTVVAMGEEFGRALVPGPALVTAGLVLPLLDALGPQAGPLKERVAGGTIVVAPVPPHSGAWAELSLNDEGHLSGRMERVPFAGDADGVLAATREDSGASLLLRLPTDDPHVVVESAEAVQIGQTTGSVEVRGLPLRDEYVLSRDSAAIAAAVDYAGATYHVLLSAMAVGNSEVLLEKSITYVSERQQFGVLIGTFQSLRHAIADMRAGVDMARALTVSGCRELAQGGSDRDLDIAAARMVSARVALNVAEKAIQIHGGVGFTWEFDLHRWYRAALYQAVQQSDLTQVRASMADMLVAASTNS